MTIKARIWSRAEALGRAVINGLFAALFLTFACLLFFGTDLPLWFRAPVSLLVAGLALPASWDWIINSYCQQDVWCSPECAELDLKPDPSPKPWQLLQGDLERRTLAALMQAHGVTTMDELRKRIADLPYRPLAPERLEREQRELAKLANATPGCRFRRVRELRRFSRAGLTQKLRVPGGAIARYEETSEAPDEHKQLLKYWMKTGALPRPSQPSERR